MDLDFQKRLKGIDATLARLERVEAHEQKKHVNEMHAQIERYPRTRMGMMDTRLRKQLGEELRYLQQNYPAMPIELPVSLSMQSGLRFSDSARTLELKLTKDGILRKAEYFFFDERVAETTRTEKTFDIRDFLTNLYNDDIKMLTRFIRKFYEKNKNPK